MLRNLTEYHWAEHIDDALLLLARLDIKTVPIAGGTYLLGLDDESIEAVVDLRDLELAYISEDTRGIYIGPMTTLQSMADAPLLKELASGLLSSSASASSSSRLIRNSATIGGTLAVGAASQADLLTAFTAMEAQVVVRSGSRTEVNLSGGTSERPGLALSGVVYKGKQERRVASDALKRELRPNELIVEVIVPRPDAICGASFARIGRTPTDTALMNAVALVEIENNVYRRVRLALGGVNMESVRVQAVERYLEGQRIDNSQGLVDALQAGMNEVRLPADARVSSGYRRVSGTRLAQHVLEEAASVSFRCGLVSSDRGEKREVR